jgi:probable HAF family extracellular repeat protein
MAQIVGTSEVLGGNMHAFKYDDTGMQDLCTLGGSNSYAYSVLDDGSVITVIS